MLLKAAQRRGFHLHGESCTGWIMSSPPKGVPSVSIWVRYAPNHIREQFVILANYIIFWKTTGLVIGSSLAE